jgi:hypothetical protein
MARIIAIIFLAYMLVLTGCSGLAHSSITGTAQTIVAKTLLAMNKVKSFALDTDITNTYKTIEGSRTNTTEWKGTKLVDVSKKEMAISMVIPQTYSGANMDASLEMYFKGGGEYLKGLVTSGGPNPWIKIRLNAALWKRETQISYISELLKTALQVSTRDNESIKGVDCYVLTVTPSVQSAVDFTVSQEQPFGTQIDTMWGGVIPVVRPDAYQSGSIKLWIGRNSNLPVNVEVNIDFQGNVGGGDIPLGSTPYTPTTNPIDSSFQGQLTFSNYNQPVSIPVPQEALNAKEK